MQFSNSDLASTKLSGNQKSLAGLCKCTALIMAFIRPSPSALPTLLHLLRPLPFFDILYLAILPFDLLAKIVQDLPHLNLNFIVFCWFLEYFYEVVIHLHGSAYNSM